MHNSKLVVADGQLQTITNPTPIYYVVFVVEAVVALCGYFDLIKTNYILPTLEHFNGGPPSEIDYGCKEDNFVMNICDNWLPSGH